MQQSNDESRPGMSSQTMAERAPWLVDVDVYLEKAGDKPVFRMETCLPFDPDRADNTTIVFHNRCRPGFEIKFNLIDETGGGYCFPPNGKREEALWSRVGPECPPYNYGQQWDEFRAVRVIEPDRSSLIVRNTNRTPTLFGYTLRVTNDGGRSYCSLDPVGSNQNGSSGRI